MPTRCRSGNDLQLASFKWASHCFFVAAGAIAILLFSSQTFAQQSFESSRGLYAISFPTITQDQSLSQVRETVDLQGRSIIESAVDGAIGEDSIRSEDWYCSVHYRIGPLVQVADPEAVRAMIGKQRKIKSENKVQRQGENAVLEFVCDNGDLASIVRVVQTPGRMYTIELAERRKEKKVRLVKEIRQGFFDSFKPLDSSQVTPIAREGTSRSDNALGLQMIWVPAGKFLMGTRRGDPGYDTSETAGEVELTSGFWLANTETTQQQWRALVGTEPYLPEVEVFESGISYPGFRPIGKRIPFQFLKDPQEALEFCAILTDVERAEGRIGKDWCYTLPTEAQWEYACRAGSTGSFCFGDDPQKLANFAWFSGNSGRPGQQFCKEVAKKKPNAWGFFDMHGNVSEFCLDLVSTNEEFVAGKDPIGIGGNPLVRGGDVGCDAVNCRSAERRRASSNAAAPGFRIALVRSEVLDPDKLRPAQLANRLSVLDPKRSVPKTLASIESSETSAKSSLNRSGPLSAYEFIWCPAGGFLMGSRPGQKFRSKEESCQPTWISKGFYIGKTELTSKIAHQLGWTEAPSSRNAEDFPVRLNYHRIKKLCEALTESERNAGRLPDGYVIRLPTEAEWEYACRAGSNSTYYWGDGSDAGEQYRVVNKSDSSKPVFGIVAQRKPNFWGIHDMIGNSPEYCLDLFQPYLLGGADPYCAWGDITQPVIRGRYTSSDRSYATAPLFVRQPELYTNYAFRLVIGPKISNQSTVDRYPRDTTVAVNETESNTQVQQLAIHSKMLLMLTNLGFVNGTGLLIASVKYDTMAGEVLRSASLIVGDSPPLIDKEVGITSTGTIILRDSSSHFINPNSFINRLNDRQENINDKVNRLLEQHANRFVATNISVQEATKLRIGWLRLTGPSREMLRFMGYSEKNSSAIRKHLDNLCNSGQEVHRFDVVEQQKAIDECLQQILDEQSFNAWKAITSGVDFVK